MISMPCSVQSASPASLKWMWTRQFSRTEQQIIDEPRDSLAPHNFRVRRLGLRLPRGAPAALTLRDVVVFRFSFSVIQTGA